MRQVCRAAFLHAYSPSHLFRSYLYDRDRESAENSGRNLCNLSEQLPTTGGLGQNAIQSLDVAPKVTI